MPAHPSNTFHFLLRAMTLQSSRLSSLTHSDRTVLEAIWIAEIIPSQGFLFDNLAPRAGAFVMMDDAALWVVDVAVEAVAAMWETFATPVAAVRIAKRDAKGIHAALRTTVVVQEEDVADQGPTVPSPTVVADVVKMARSALLEAQPVVVVAAAEEMSLLLEHPSPTQLHGPLPLLREQLRLQHDLSSHLLSPPPHQHQGHRLSI